MSIWSINLKGTYIVNYVIDGKTKTIFNKTFEKPCSSKLLYFILLKAINITENCIIKKVFIFININIWKINSMSLYFFIDSSGQSHSRITGYGRNGSQSIGCEKFLWKRRIFPSLLYEKRVSFMFTFTCRSSSNFEKQIHLIEYF